MDRRKFLSGLAASWSSPVTANLHTKTNTYEPESNPDLEQDLVQPHHANAKRHFSLSEIRLLPGPVETQQADNRRYLLKLEPDRLLSCYRQEAGLEPKAPPYRGWESEGRPLWGHMLGFYLSGSSHMVQATNDAELRRRLHYIADELSAIQDANGSGYLLAVPEGKRLFAEIAQGRFEITHAEPKYGYEINGVFEPTYTWNKVTLGLFQAYIATGSSRLKEILIRTADWLGHDVIDGLSDAQVQKLLFCEHGSIHESMLSVYRLTGDQKYLRWARRLCFERMIAPLAEGNGAFLNGYHANCSIPIYTGLEAIYQHTGEKRLHDAAVNFLNEVIDNRSWANGGNSASEHFFSPDEFEEKLRDPAGPETCNSVNMLRLIETVYQASPDPKFMDHYEKILFNHLLPAHEPERCQVNYYTPMQPGSYRVYSDEFDSMWCCVGTGLECPGKYAQMIYTRGADNGSLDINLFIASRLTWDDAGFVLQQDTAFPEKRSTLLTVVSASHMPLTLRIRHPWWVPAGQIALTLNGKPVVQNTAPGEYVVIRRGWRAGDRVEVQLPMEMSISMLPGSKNYAAVFFGPILLSGMLGRNGLHKSQFWHVNSAISEENPPEIDRPPLAFDPRKLASDFQVDDGESSSNLIFKIKTTAGSVNVAPFYRNHYQRYVIYWRLIRP